MIKVSIDGIRVHDLDAMDMDEFKEWLWPGVICIETRYKSRKKPQLEKQREKPCSMFTF